MPFFVNVRTKVQEELDDFVVAIVGRDVYWAFSIVPQRIDIGTETCKQPHGVGPPVLRCNEQRCCTIAPELLNVSTEFHEQVNAIDVPVCSQHEQ